jgi:2-keto-4-pentenoate hydratase
MLLSAQATRFAHQLLEARAHARTLSPLSQTNPALSMADGYDVAKSILTIRTAQGEDAVGRRIGHANRAVMRKHRPDGQIDAPIWAFMFDSTVRYTQDNHGVQSLRGALQPRIEPHIVFKLAKTPAPEAKLADIADCIEWMAAGLEIVVCPFPDWKFDTVDAVAAFGLHGSLIVGEPKMLSEATRRNLAPVLADASVSLSVAAADYLALRGAGFGRDILNSPVHGLWRLHRMLQSQSQFKPLAAGEIVASGGLTEAYPVQPGETWISAFSGAALAGLSVSFV